MILLDPKHAEAYNYVGYMYAEKGIRLDEAQRLIQKALELEPENGYYIDSLGWAYYQQGRYTDAVRELRRAVELTTRQGRRGHLRPPRRGLSQDRGRAGRALRLGEVARARPRQRDRSPEDPAGPSGG